MPTALLVIDIQRALCSGDEAACAIEEVIQRINALSKAARARGVPVVVIQHEEEGSPLAHGSEGWQLDERLQTSPSDLNVRKTTPNSFYKTRLGELLQDRHVKRLVVCGLQTEFCIDTTVRQALAKGYDVVLAADAHSTADSETLTASQIAAHHNRTLGFLNTFDSPIAVVPTQEILATGYSLHQE